MVERVVIRPSGAMKYTQDVVAEIMLKADEYKTEQNLTDVQIAAKLGIPRRSFEAMRARYRRKRHEYYRAQATEFITSYINRQLKYIHLLEEEGHYSRASHIDNELITKLQSFGYVIKVSDKLQVDANVKTNWVDVLKKYKLIEESKDERIKKQV